MGKQDLGPLRVYQNTQRLLQIRGRGLVPPPWFRVVGEFPPSEALVRPLPVQHRQPRLTRKTKKASRLFQPQRIAYEEDPLRHEFFGDHPWELARPRVILENDGKDYQRWDWSKSHEPGRPINGESVVQRQKWLLSQTTTIEEGGKKKRVPLYTTAKAYDKARKEFYELRHYEAVEQRVAQEEALAVGAYFGQSANQIGMGLEMETFEKWKSWANEQVVVAEQARNAAYSGSSDDPEGAEAETPNTLEAAVEVLERSIPNSKRGQDALGGAPFHP